MVSPFNEVKQVNILPTFEDAQHSRNTLNGLDAFQGKSLGKSIQYDRGSSDVILSDVSARPSPIHAVLEHSSGTIEGGRAHSFRKNDLTRLSSPEIGPKRLRRGVHFNFRQENLSHHTIKQQQEILTTYEHPVEFSNNQPRALIEAYGSSKSSCIHPQMPSKFPQLGDNRVSTDTTVSKWDHPDEDEYLWDDMSPTLAHRSRRMKLTKYDTPQGRYSIKPHLRKPDASILDLNFKSSYSSVSAHSPSDKHSFNHEGRKAVIGSSQRPGNGEHLGVEMSESLQSQSNYWGKKSWMPDYMQSSKNSSLSSGLPTVNQSYLPFNCSFNGNMSMQRLPNIRSDSVNTASAPFLPLASAKKHLLQETDPTDSRMFVTASGQCSVMHPLTQKCDGSLPQSQFQPRESSGNNSPSAMLQVSDQLIVQPPNQLAEHVQICSSSQLLSSLSCDLHPSCHLPGKFTDALMAKPAENIYMGLISSLMSKGLISLPQVTFPKDFVGIDFNPDCLKVRHESVVENLYASLPRQCTTCGLRFRCQEDHRTHMDWHVTKNRMLKNHKQKPSRKWFVSAKEWLSGAETLGTDSVPGFLPIETVTERKEDRELAVAADLDQNLCALCGEAFEEFYNDEADEWMYKGAVYLNAPEGHLEDLCRSQLGPIIHAKCQSKSSKK